MDDIDILQFRRELFKKYQQQLDGMIKNRNKVMNADGRKFSEKSSGANSTPFMNRMDLVLKSDKEICDAMVKAIDKTKEEAKLAEKVRELEKKLKVLK